MQPVQILNKHLDKIMLGGKAYDRAKAERVYAKLTAPKKPGIFYEANRVRGEIHPDGEVVFQSAYPELADHFNPGGWSFASPEEMGMTRTSAKPVKGMGQMNKAFDELMASPQGAGLYYNMPTSTHRADAYTKRGFVPAPDETHQLLDNRRFRNNPTIAELLAVQDAKQFGAEDTVFLRQNLVAKHPQISAAVKMAIDPNVLVDSMSDAQVNAWLASF